METVFEVPQPEVPKKKPRKKRVLTPAQKKAFVDRMRKSREERKAKKNETLAQKVVVDTPKEIVDKTQEVVDKPQKVIKKSIEQPSQSNINFDYSTFNNLTDNIKLLNETLYNLSRPAPQPKQEPPPQPKQIVENKPVDIVPQHTKDKEINQATASVTCPVPIVVPPKPEKKKVWNCRRKCFVYI